MRLAHLKRQQKKKKKMEEGRTKVETNLAKRKEAPPLQASGEGRWLIYRKSRTKRLATDVIPQGGEGTVSG